MKILLATGIYPPEIGGPATYAKLLADRLPARDIEVDVLPFSEVRRFPRILRHIAYFIKVAIRSHGADVIFTQDPVSTGIPVAKAAFLMRKPVVIRVPGDYAWEQARQRFGVTDTVEEFQTKKYSATVEFLKNIERVVVNRADIVITPSHYFGSIISNWLKDKSKLKVIHNGIDPHVSFEKLPKYGEKTIITAGRLIYGKGFDTLIRLLPKLTEWRLVIVGDGPDREKFLELARENGVSDRVVLSGRMSQHDLFVEINRCHIFALLSAFETFSFQIVEAMAIGVPVIATNRGGAAEIIQNGVSGLSQDPDDVETFIANVRKIETDESFKNKLIENGKARAHDFSIDKTIDSLVEVFRRFEKK